MGLPFFTPAYIPGNRVRIYGGHSELEAALRRQMEPPSFPVPFSYFKADIEFFHLVPGSRHEINGMGVSWKCSGRVQTPAARADVANTTSHLSIRRLSSLQHNSLVTEAQGPSKPGADARSIAPESRF